MTQVAVGLYGLQGWFGGDFAPVMDVVHTADQAGHRPGEHHRPCGDGGEHVQKYPYGKFPAPSDYPWYEPLTVLAAIAAVTRRSACPPAW